MKMNQILIQIKNIPLQANLNMNKKLKPQQENF